MQDCHVRNAAAKCRLGLLQSSEFAGDREHSMSTSGAYYASSGVACLCQSFEYVHLRKTNVRTNQLDMQEAILCLAQ